QWINRLIIINAIDNENDIRELPNKTWVRFLVKSIVGNASKEPALGLRVAEIEVELWEGKLRYGFFLVSLQSEINVQHSSNPKA
ncbi:MAG: hypothetical protein KBT28_11675, partial [Bacteroidales bacterium]|nr:hypothetical protein [Candidatus Colimorpha merdihippi]